MDPKTLAVAITWEILSRAGAEWANTKERYLDRMVYDHDVDSKEIMTFIARERGW